ncbi:PDR/VanB family oxidoreductase [Rhodococcus erythropolis]|uniref:PDR/VanB family oxidoreductase n=1 Tax=Rhodococcus erythropolis TaxID=1833 RepID=UPI0024B67FB2|nr:PDR/VanB family oxidoreductase [Rhodococcus erythropolis]MDJ0012228.1 PDR/VanB family oxidoreductase [Rhodococcus erythropolis]
MTAATLSLRVNKINDIDGEIRTISLIPEDGKKLPSFPPGSHIGLQWREGRSNFYSLTNDGHQPATYEVAVLRRDDGAGGSRWVHRLRVGEIVRTNVPRSGFSPAAFGRHHILVSGGVGITPIISHARWHRTWGGSFEVWHVGPENEILTQLRSIAGERVFAYRHRDDFWNEFSPRLREAPFGSHVYTCGPTALIEGVADAAVERGWVMERIHAESFCVVAVHGEPFVAVAQRAGQRVKVDGETALLDALENAGIAVPSMCRNGVCGKCITPVISGGIDHRDSYLGDTEREAGNVMMPCVSRALEQEVVLDL